MGTQGTPLSPHRCREKLLRETAKRPNETLSCLGNKKFQSSLLVATLLCLLGAWISLLSRTSLWWNEQLLHPRMGSSFARPSLDS